MIDGCASENSGDSAVAQRVLQAISTVLARLIHVVRDFAVAFGLPDCRRAASFGYFPV